MIATKMRLAGGWVAALVLAGTADAAVVTAGGPGCDFIAVQGAIDASHPGDEIRLLTTLAINDQPLTLPPAVGAKTIVGGFASCQDAAPSGARTVLRGNASNSVLRIDNGGGSALYPIVLRNLEIANGGSATVEGGGIYLNTTYLRLDNVVVRNNTAARGGGIYVYYTQNEGLELVNGSEIRNNTAEDGGGIYFRSGVGRFAPVSTIAFNSATRDGGGMFYNSGFLVIEAAGLAGGGYPTTGGFYSNTAGRDGGAIYYAGLFATFGFGQLYFRVGSEGNPLARPPSIFFNQAGRNGGGIHYTHESQLSAPSLSLRGALLANNRATERGGALYLAQHVRVDIAQISEFDVSGYVCLPSECNRYRQNEAGAGGAIYANLFDGSAGLYLRQARFDENRAVVGAVLQIEAGTVDAERVLMHDNTCSTGAAACAVVQVLGQSRARFAYSTSAGHPAVTNTVFNGGAAQLHLKSSIFYDDVRAFTLPPSPQDFIADCLLVWVSSNSLMTQITRGLVSDPLFRDASGRNFTLGPLSPAIDFCNENQAPRRFPDLVLRTDDIDQPARPNTFGVTDIGAYLYGESIFAHGFE